MDRKLVKANLNPYFYNRVKQEACRRRENCRWVRVSLEGQEPVSSLLRELEKQLGALLPIVKCDRHSATVNCPDDEAKATLIDWDKGTFQGARFRILPVLYEMTGDEILNFVLRTLENEEDYEVDEACNDLKTRGRDRGRYGRNAQRVQASHQEEPDTRGRSDQERQPQNSPKNKKKNKNKNKNNTPDKGDDNYWTTVTRKGKGKGKGKCDHDNGRPRTPPRAQDQRESQNSRGRGPPSAPEPYYPFVSSSGKGGKGKGQGDWCRHCSMNRLPCDHHYLKCQVTRDILNKNLPINAPQAGNNTPTQGPNTQPNSQGAQGSPRRSG